MANNRLFLICTKCKLAHDDGIMLPHAREWSLMLAKYYPSQGWNPWGEVREKLTKFLKDHSHGTQWGANIVSELEITEDEPVIESAHSS